MEYAGFCGSSNPTRSLIADGERTVNLYYEQVQARFAPTQGALYPTPGRRAFLTVPDAGGRALFSAEGTGRVFAVIGGGFYELFSTQTAIKRGDVAQDNYPATISFNSASGGQLLITSGTNGYHFALGTNTFTTVLTNEVTMGGMIDGRFLAFNIVTGQVRLSALNDGTTWTAQFFARSAESDMWQAMVIGNSEIWMLGSVTGEVWYNSGASPQPFALNRGSVFPSGTRAPFSAKRIGDSIVWVSATKDGGGQIMRAQGYNPEPISNYAIETALGQYARAATIDDAEMMTYEQEGHAFAISTYPSGPGTWAIDMQTGSVHELGTWNPLYGRYDAWGPRVHCYAFHKHLVADRTSGIISEMDLDIGNDLGAPIRRLRIPPPIYASSREQLLISRLSLRIEAGLGLGTGQGSDPKIMMRASKDGKRWSAERMAGVGRQGEYGARTYWTQLGSSETLWVPEISFTEPIPLRIVGAELEGSGFAQTRAA